MQQDERKVLLRITNLKQYFPLSKKGLYVKANDGISIDIYEGETFGLVGESGCGKSTLGRTILQIYKQTDGRTMYYGRTLDEVAPKYVKNTLTNLHKMRDRYYEAQKKYDAFKADYDKHEEREQFMMANELAKLKKEANDALLDITNIIGGFIVAEKDDLEQVSKVFLKEYGFSKQLKDEELDRMDKQIDYDDIAYEIRMLKEKYEGLTKEEKDGGETAVFKSEMAKLEAQLAKAQAALDAVDAKTKDIKKAIVGVKEEIQAMREKYADNEQFAYYEQYRDDGVDLARLVYSEMRLLRSDLQLIFQDPYSSLNPKMSVANIIGEGMIAHKYFKHNDDRMKEEVLRVMDNCGLAPYFLHRFPHQFSGGQRQRIGIARSLAVRPKFVVCDEAVSALDVSIQSQIINLLQDLKEKQNLTYLFITHDLSVVKYISDRIGVMYLGTMVELAESQEIFDHPLHPYTEALLNAIPTTDKKHELIILEGDIPSPVNPPKGCKFHTRCRYCTEICEHAIPDFKEVRPGHFVACHHVLEQNV